MTKPEKPMTIGDALRIAVAKHYAQSEDQIEVEAPLGEVLAALAYLSVTLSMAQPTQAQRHAALNYVADMMTASEIAVASGMPLEQVIAQLRGETIH